MSMKITLAGIGMGSPGGMTVEALSAVREAGVILGSERMLHSLRDVPGMKIPAPLPEDVLRLITDHPEWEKENIVVALSGDVGVHSGARKLLALLDGHDVRLLPGVSSAQCFAARLRRPWQSFHIVSAHGAACDVLAEVMNHPEVFFLTGGGGAASVIRELCAAGLADARVSVGENLSSHDENISAGTAGELAGRAFSPLSVVLVENQRAFARSVRTAGIADAEFIRGKAPMTKREVRAVVLSLLELSENAVAYDIGTGTGSVAVEMAFAARRGRVYAVDSDDEACALAGQNREAFGVFNMAIIRGAAPDALSSLPAPDAAFIGGSKGRMRDIVSALVRKNPAVRIVVSAVTVETLARATEAFQECGLADIDVTQIAVTRTVTRGASRMFDAQNPVFLISGGGRHS